MSRPGLVQVLLGAGSLTAAASRLVIARTYTRPVSRRSVGLALILLLAACGSPPRPSGRSQSPATTIAAESPGTPAAQKSPTWERLDARGPGARKDYSFAADASGSSAVLFGGRAKGKPLGDTWVFDTTNRSWREVAGKGPPARFGHNSHVVGGRVLVFGGQAGSDFFNDLWTFDLGSSSWTQIETKAGPDPRYGAGAAVIDGKLFLSHGFTSAGRFDDTWAFDSSWVEVSPGGPGRPIKRCLHRMAQLGSSSKALLFGGQTNGNPFLGDTWIYDAASRAWSEVSGPGPSARNLYSLATTGERVILFGGRDAQGPKDDLWAFEAGAWRQLEQGETRPTARSGIESPVLRNKLLVFGGEAESGELADLWQLTLG